MRIGGLVDADPEGAVTRAEAYLANDAGGKPYSYPWYDTFETNGDPTTLCDADLLAPLLLNAAPDLTGYRTLKDWMKPLSDGLQVLCDQVPVSDQPLVPDDPRHGLVGALYEPLDAAGPGGHVSGTILAKVLHRKRPDVVPLYDHRVLSVYRDAPAARIPQQRDRTWVEFMTLLSRRISEDITQPEATALVERIRALAKHGEITRLRAWDIVVWQAAGEGSAHLAP